MLSFRYFKADPTTYVLQYRKGAIKRQGVGLSFFYFEPSTALVAIPVASQEAAYMMKESTADFQEVTLQGQVVFRVNEPERLAGMMNYTLSSDGKDYQSKDPEKLADRILNLVQVMLRAEVQALTLRDALAASKPLVQSVGEQLRQSDVLANLGIQVVDFAIQAIRPAPETARALEAAAREAMLQEADEAVYSRRNAAIEQERSIKESELKTELAVEARKREIRESQIEADRSVKEKERQIRREQMDADVVLEETRQQLVDLATANERKQGEAKAYAMEKMMDAFSKLDPAFVEAMAASGMEPDRIIAQAFKGLANNAGKIGQLNISPELLNSLMGGARA